MIAFQHFREDTVSIEVLSRTEECEVMQMNTDWNGQRRPLWRKRIRILIITALVILVLYFAARFAVSKVIESQMKVYTPISNNSPIVQLTVISTNTNHKWKVEIFRYDSSGNLVPHPQILLEPCDHWMVKADIFSIPSWVALGVPAGWYKLTDIEGSDCYDEHGQSVKRIQTISLNAHPALAVTAGQFLNLVSSMPVTSASIHPDGITYNVSITPTSLAVAPER